MVKPFWLWSSPHIDDHKIKRIFKNERRPSFYSFAAIMFSHVKDPSEAFRYMDKETFCKNWPAIKTKIKTDAWFAHMAEHWQPIYEKTLAELKEEGVRIHQIPDIDITPQRIQLARRLREIRVKAGYTQKWMARLLDVKQPFISKLEAGKVNVSFDMLYKIAGACLKGVRIEFVS
jgi:DNA-binding XRE family transcriptional regulator